MLQLQQLFLSGRPIFLFLAGPAGGGGVLSPNGEVVGDRITGGSAKKILLLVQRDQILLARSYFLCEDAPGRMSM